MKRREKTNGSTTKNSENNSVKKQKFSSHYAGYKIDSSKAKLDVISIQDLDPTEFELKYVLNRKPCIINGIIPGFDLNKFKMDQIVKTLNCDEYLQVEKKIDGGYGSGANRLKMKLGELIDSLQSGNDQLYLTTQYDEDDIDESDHESEYQEEDDSDLEDQDEPSTEIPLFDNASDFSDGDSIDMNCIKDDFDELEDEDEDADEDEDEDDVIISKDCVGGDLTLKEAKVRLKELLPNPLTNLINEKDSFNIHPPILKSLIPQQINIWMGIASNKVNNWKIDQDKPNLGLGKWIPTIGGSSSGLHHDHADNLYIPVSGRKRFTLFSPDQATNLYTVGTVDKVYNSGVIDYKRDENAPHWKHLRSDGAMISEAARWKLENDTLMSKKERRKLMDIIEQEENIKVEYAKEGEVKKDPASFSRIPPSLLHLDEVKDANKSKLMNKLKAEKFPKLMQSISVKVDLKPGQMLYLPAGWFHEVTSFGSIGTEDNSHIAVNYWYAPPDGNDSSNLYKDQYWKEDFKRTECAINHLKGK